MFASQGYQEQLDALKDEKAEQLKLLSHLYGELEVCGLFSICMRFLHSSTDPSVPRTQTYYQDVYSRAMLLA